MKKKTKTLLWITGLIISATLFSGCSSIGNFNKNSKKSAELNIIEEKEIQKLIKDCITSQDNIKETAKVLKKYDKDTIWNCMQKVILQNTKNISEPEDYSANTIEVIQQLYTKSFSESRDELEKSIAYSQQIQEMQQRIKDFSSRYPYNMEKAFENCSSMDVYISSRLEQGYEDNLLGNVQKEIDSYKTPRYSKWVAHNIEYDVFLGEYPGDEIYILYSSDVDHFSATGIYNIVYFDNGDTNMTKDDRGFRKELPLFYLIDYPQLEEDYQKLQELKQDLQEIIKELRTLNGAVEDSKKEQKTDNTTNLIPETQFQWNTVDSATDTVTVTDILNTQWTMQNNASISFSISGTENSPELLLYETDNPNEVYYHGWSMNIIETTEADLYITFAFGEMEEIAIAWYSKEQIDSPELIALNQAFAEYNGAYQYSGTLMGENDISIDPNTPYYADEGETMDIPHEMIEESSSVFLTDEDVYWMTPNQLRIAKNEIYARHGRKFSDQTLQEWFNAQDWYVGFIEPKDFDESMLSEIEKENIRVIQHRTEVNSQ